MLRVSFIGFLEEGLVCGDEMLVMRWDAGLDLVLGGCFGKGERGRATLGFVMVLGLASVGGKMEGLEGLDGLDGVDIGLHRILHTARRIV